MLTKNKLFDSNHKKPLLFNSQQKKFVSVTTPAGATFYVQCKQLMC